MKIQFIFETVAGETVTNDRLFNTNKNDWTDEEFENCGCIVVFDTVPMIQDYQKIVNDMWLSCLQFSAQLKKFDKRLKKVTTVLVDN